MRVALHTNRLTDFFRGDRGLQQFLSECDEVWIPFIVLGEMKAGFFGGVHTLRNEGLLNAFLMKPTVQVLMADRGTVDAYARLVVQLKQGRNAYASQRCMDRGAGLTAESGTGHAGSALCIDSATHPGLRPSVAGASEPAYCMQWIAAKPDIV